MEATRESVLLDVTVGTLPATRIVVRELLDNEVTPFSVTTDKMPTHLSTTYCPNAMRVSRAFLAHLMAVGLPEMDVRLYFLRLSSILGQNPTWRRSMRDD